VKLIEPPKPPKRRLLSAEQTSAWQHQVLRLAVVLAGIGTVGFLLPFLFRTILTTLGIQWTNIQSYSLVVVFVGGVLFVLSASYFGIDIRWLTLDRLLAIIRNEVYAPPEEGEHLRRQLKAALSSLDDRWSLYPRVNLERSGHLVPFVLLGPGGVFAIDLNIADPRKGNYVDPGPGLASGCTVLQGMLSEKVVPVLLFHRYESHYKNTHPQLKVFTTEQLVAWLTARSQTMERFALRAADDLLRQHQVQGSL
jgi:hypothetical protein